MVVFVFPDPEAEAKTYLASLAATHPAGTTYSTAFPDSALTHPHVQIAWDGTPSDESNRELPTMRFTVWTPKGQRTAGKNLASLVRAQMLDFASATIWRTTRGTGRLPGIDSDTGLPFVTFTVTTETRPAAVSP